MHLFYEPNILTNNGMLNDEESRHCIKVLRHHSGDTIHVIDGKGTKAVCTITNASSKSCEVKIEETELQHPPEQKCHIAIAPTKSIDRFEWFLEKSTELGVDEITPLFCHQSERKHLKLPRLERVITAATKQSLRLWRPKINPMVGVFDFLEQQHSEQQKFIAHCEGSTRIELVEHLRQTGNREDALILIGPEGDFSEEEIKKALKNGYEAAALGENRLRTETAGIVACMIVKMLHPL
jgi:16S rRNA (uracil1498-N3)-methyltransferase